MTRKVYINEVHLLYTLYRTCALFLYIFIHIKHVFRPGNICSDNTTFYLFKNLMYLQRHSTSSLSFSVHYHLSVSVAWAAFEHVWLEIKKKNSGQVTKIWAAFDIWWVFRKC